MKPKKKDRECEADNDNEGDAPVIVDTSRGMSQRSCKLLSLFAVAKKLSSQHKVRTSVQDRTLESMLPMSNTSRSDAGNSGKALRLGEVKESKCDLTSIVQLRGSIMKNIHHGWQHFDTMDDVIYYFFLDLTEIIRNHTFVGIVDDVHCLSLIQHNTKLYLVNHAALAYVFIMMSRGRLTGQDSEEMFYQLALMQFSGYKRLRLDPPPPLHTLLKLAVDAEADTERTGLGKNEIVDVSVDLRRSVLQLPIPSAHRKKPRRSTGDAVRIFRFGHF